MRFKTFIMVSWGPNLVFICLSNQGYEHLQLPHECNSEMGVVATPLWPSVGVKPNTSKVGDLESSGTPESLGFDSKAQKTSH
jgi:hypothetical protein